MMLDMVPIIIQYLKRFYNKKTAAPFDATVLLI